MFRLASNASLQLGLGPLCIVHHQAACVGTSCPPRLALVRLFVHASSWHGLWLALVRLARQGVLQTSPVSDTGRSFGAGRWRCGGITAAWPQLRAPAFVRVHGSLRLQRHAAEAVARPVEELAHCPRLQPRLLPSEDRSIGISRFLLEVVERSVGCHQQLAGGSEPALGHRPGGGSGRRRLRRRRAGGGGSAVTVLLAGSDVCAPCCDVCGPRRPPPAADSVVLGGPAAMRALFLGAGRSGAAPDVALSTTAPPLRFWRGRRWLLEARALSSCPRDAVAVSTWTTPLPSVALPWAAVLAAPPTPWPAASAPPPTCGAPARDGRPGPPSDNNRSSSSAGLCKSAGAELRSEVEEAGSKGFKVDNSGEHTLN